MTALQTIDPRRAGAACALALVLAGCTSGSVGSLPSQPVAVAIPGNDGLSFAVGIATTEPAGCKASSIGLNTVVAYRQANGNSAVLFDTPTISGPPGFVGDNGTNTMYRTFAGLTVPGVLAGDTGSYNPLGAFGYGFAGESAAAPLPVHEYSDLPGFDYPACANGVGNLVSGLKYIGGPPAWPALDASQFPVLPTDTLNSGYVGYSMGFYDYVSATTAPPLGTYTLTVTIPVGAQTLNGSLTGGPASSVVRTAQATLASQSALPVFARPTAIRDPQHPGGLVITAVVPPGVTEAFAEVQLAPSQRQQYYTLALPTTTPGQPVSVTLPPNLGFPEPGSTTPTLSIPPAAPMPPPGSGPGVPEYFVYCVGFDYDALGPSYPLNRQQRPAILGPSGQDDVTTSSAFAGF